MELRVIEGRPAIKHVRSARTLPDTQMVALMHKGREIRGPVHHGRIDDLPSPLRGEARLGRRAYRPDTLQKGGHDAHRAQHAARSKVAQLRMSKAAPAHGAPDSRGAAACRRPGGTSKWRCVS